MDNRMSIVIFGIVLFFLNGITIASDQLSYNATNSSNTSRHHAEMFKVVDWKFESLKTYFIYAFFIIIVILMKIMYFHIPKLSVYVPESCILIFTGVLFGVIVKFSGSEEVQYFKLTPRLFFSVLLPPIILESSYSLCHRNFLDNILTILVFAVFGTLFNFIIIGLSLYGLSRFGAMLSLNMSLLHCLLFSSLIVAVDPVAVLAIFQDVGVNPDLYYLVFGESLLNDAVTVVLYEMMHEFTLMPEIGATNIVLGFISFFTVSLGGMIIGIIIGVISCLIIRVMVNKSTLLMEPILLMSTGYIAYLCGDVFGWSGIISCIACGLIQASYAFYSISDKSRLVLKRFVKIIASICEALIFLFLGVELVVGKLQWDTSFSITSLVLCLVVRFAVTFSLSGIVNKIHMSLRNIPFREKIIISYGGLRGAVAFSLAVLIKHDGMPTTGINEDIIITTTLFIILFTVIIQGITVKPLVSILKIAKKTESERLSLMDELNESVMDGAICGINSILGKCGRNYFFMIFEKWNEKYIRRVLQRNSSSSYATIAALNEKINHAIVANLTHPASSHNLHKELSGTYLNLMLAVAKHTTDLDKVEPPRKSKLLTPDVSMRPELKVGQRLHTMLINIASLSTDEDSIYEPNLTANMVNIAKNRFLRLKRRAEQVTQSLRLTGIKDIDDDDDKNNDETDLL